MISGGLQKLAEPLQAPRTTDSDDHSHDRREIARRDHHQVSLRHACESSQPCSSRPAGVADVSKVRWTPFFGQLGALDKVELGWWPARPIPRVSRGHESAHGMGAV